MLKFHPNSPFFTHLGVWSGLPVKIKILPFLLLSPGRLNSNRIIFVDIAVNRYIIGNKWIKFHTNGGIIMKLRTISFLTLALMGTTTFVRPMAYWDKAKETIKKNAPIYGQQAGYLALLGGAGFAAYNTYKWYNASKQVTPVVDPTLAPHYPLYNPAQPPIAEIPHVTPEELKAVGLLPNTPPPTSLAPRVEPIDSTSADEEAIKEIERMERQEEPATPLLPPAAPVAQPAIAAEPTQAMPIPEITITPPSPRLATPANLSGSLQLGASWSIGQGNPITARAEFARTILHGNLLDISTQPREKYLRSIVDLIWFLYDKAGEKGQAFEKEGTFLIEDKDFNIYDALLKYVKLVNPTVTGTKKDKPLHISYNPFAYPRDCSHYKQGEKLYPRYGIDVRFDENGYQIRELPASKAHILFGKVLDWNGQQWIFIKPENNGLYYKDGWAQHAGEFGTSVAKKTNLIENDDDAECNRKERVTKIFKQQMKPIIDQLMQPQVLNVDLKAMVDAEGIKSMFTIKKLVLNANNPKLPATAINALDALIEAYKSKYDHLEMRSGREVILTQEEMKQ